jgi:hypothetical protein
MVGSGGRVLDMIIRYTHCPVRTPVPALGGSMTVPRPLLVVHDVAVPSGQFSL